MIARKDLQRVAGLSPALAVKWRERGLLGRGPYSVVDVLAITLAKWLRSREIDYETVDAVAKFIGDLSESQLKEHIAADRPLLVVDLLTRSVSIERRDATLANPDRMQLLIVDLDAALRKVRTRCQATTTK